MDLVPKNLDVLVVAPGEVGHVLPMLGLAQALIRRGHRVSFCGSTKFESAIARAGAGYVPCPRERSLPERMQASNSIPSWIPARLRLLLHYREVLVETARDLVSDLEEGAGDRRFDCVVGDFLTGMGARYFAERRGTPYGSLAPTPLTAFDERAFPLLSPRPLLRRLPRGVVARAVDLVYPLARLRRDLGLRTKANLVPELVALGASEELHIVFAHRGFFPDVVPARRGQYFVGPYSYDTHTVENRAQLEEDIDPSTVLVTTTTTSRDQGLLGRALRGIAPLGMPVLATRGGATDLPPDLGAHVRIVDFLPHDVVIPRVAAIVTHGGWGTVSRALRHGVPMLLLPLFGDQPAIAARAQALGLAYHLPAAVATEAAIGEKLQELLADAALRQRTRALAQQLRGLDPPVRAAQLVEQLAARTSSQPRQARIVSAPRSRPSLSSHER